MRGAKGTCSVCQSPDARTINEQIRSGTALRALARDYHYGIATLVRHRAEGHDRKAAPAPPVKASGTPEPAALEMKLPDQLPDSPAAKMLKELSAMHLGALRRYSEALRDGTLRDVAQLAATLRKNLELRAKLQTQLLPDARTPAERLQDHPDWLASILASARALDPFPDARLAVIAALEEVAGPVAALHRREPAA